ncbi:MAG: hypothetical protein KAJ55_00395 [Anaerolineales bacterium]|nr:hypothetical protein [Anaerolineales bacterium]
MTRKPWMPDPTLSAWVTFFGKLLALFVIMGSGLFYLSEGVMGLRGIRPEVDRHTTILNQLVVSDSLQQSEMVGLRSDLSDFRIEMRCVVGIIVEGDIPGWSDCPISVEKGTIQ